MTEFSRCWLVVNPASGSNDEQSNLVVRQSLDRHEVTVERMIAFPDEDLPTIADLEQAENPLIVVFAGDGTVNSLVTSLEGWGGAVLVLPGGTMNLLAKRLHRDLPIDQIVALVSAGASMPRRVASVHCDAGVALAGLLVGPGTCWAKVRESMRDIAIADVATGTIEAVRNTANGPPVLARDRLLAKEAGYPLVELTPGEHGIEINGYYAEDALDLAEQAWATLRRRFREGPHDHLGMAGELTLASSDGGSLPCLIDGEPVDCPSPAKFVVAPCNVDLLATSHEL